MKKKLAIALLVLLIFSGCAKSFGIDGKYTQYQSLLTISDVDTTTMGGVDKKTVLTIDKNIIQISTQSVGGGEIIYKGKLTTEKNEDNGKRLSIKWDKRPDVIEEVGKLYDMDFEYVDSDLFYSDSDTDKRYLFLTLNYNLNTNGKTLKSFYTYIFE